jgi:S1-C subfamily serine protease
VYPILKVGYMKQFLLILTIAAGYMLGQSLLDTAKVISDKLSQIPVIFTTENMPSFSISENRYNDALVKHNNFPVVRIHDEDGNFLCSGTIISRDYVLTAAHCVIEGNKLSSQAYTIKVLSDDKSTIIKSIKSKAVAANANADYALIKGDYIGLSTIPIAVGVSESLERSDSVLTCGFPYGAERNICYGTSDFSVYFFRLASKGILYPGMSGGPVYDVKTNRLVGVNSAVGQGFIITTSLVGLFETLGVEVHE